MLDAVSNESTEPRDLRDYLKPVLARWWLILAVVPLVTAATYFYYDHKPKVYTASTELFVQPSTLQQILLGSTPSTTTSANVENLSLLIQTKVVAEQANRHLAKSHVKSAGGSISAQPLEESNFIVVTATAATARGAAALANAYAEAFVEIQARQLDNEATKTRRVAETQLEELGNSHADTIRREAIEEKIQTLELVGAQSTGSAGIKQVEPAVPPSLPIEQDATSHAIFAFIVSLMIAIGAAFGLEYMNRKITTVEGVGDAYELPILSEIPKIDKPAPLDESGVGMAREFHEPFQRLQMNMEMLSRQRPLRMIVVASAVPGEGKSLVTRNLALAYREAGKNVAVFDADFRKAALGELLDAKEGPGLTDILAGRVNFGQAVQEVQVHSNGNGASHDPVMTRSAAVGLGRNQVGELAMVPAGAPTGNVSSALSSVVMRQTLSTAVDTYGTAIIDSPPLLAVADVLPLLSEADGVLLVTRLGVSTRDSTQRLMAELRRVPNINVIGVVVNGIPKRLYRTRAYGYYYG